MTDDRSLERAARSWLEIGPTEAPERAVDAALLQIESTPQERDWYVPWRLPQMTTPARVAAAAVIGVLVIGGAFFVLRPGDSSVGGPGATISPTPSLSPSPLASGSQPPGSYVVKPFSEPGSNWCFVAPAPFPSPPPSGCTDSKSDDSIRITLAAVPEDWTDATVFVASEYVALRAEEFHSPDGAALGFGRGAWLHSDPCMTEEERIQDGASPDIEVGPTVDDFAVAIADHPILDATTPAAVTLAGYSGKYIDLQLPADLSGCEYFWPWEPGIYAQGPSQRWQLWILDVEGVRVVVQAMDYPGTSAQHKAELQAMVDSIRIEP